MELAFPWAELSASGQCGMPSVKRDECGSPPSTRVFKAAPTRGARTSSAVDVVLVFIKTEGEIAERIDVPL